MSDAPPSAYKDQTVGPPWEFDEAHMQVNGTKRRTRGQVSVLKLLYREDDGAPELYHPRKAQALALGRAMVGLLNHHRIVLPDMRHRIVREKSPVREQVEQALNQFKSHIIRDVDARAVLNVSPGLVIDRGRARLGDPVDKHKRMCSACQQLVRLHDKWRWTDRVSGTLVHRDCSNPTGYGKFEPATIPDSDGIGSLGEWT